MAKGWTVVILIMILDVDVTAKGGIINLRRSRHHNPRGQRPVKLTNPPALGPVNLKNLFLGTFRTLDTKCPSFTT